MAKDSLPRGTRVVTRAFFAAANGFPEASRPILIKAALATIRDDLKIAREKAATVKAKVPPKKAAAKSASKPAPRKAPAAVAKKPAPQAPAPAKTKKAAPKKSATKRPAGSNPQPVADASDVAETTSPEVVPNEDE